MNANKMTLKQRTPTSYEVIFTEKNSLNEALILQINEVNMYKLIESVYNLFINNKKN